MRIDVSRIEQLRVGETMDTARLLVRPHVIQLTEEPGKLDVGLIGETSVATDNHSILYTSVSFASATQ